MVTYLSSQIKRTSKDELINDVLLWTPTHGRASVWQPAKSYLHQLCEDIRCNFEDLPGERKSQENLRSQRDLMIIINAKYTCDILTFDSAVN